MGHIPRHCKMAQPQRRAGVPRRGPGIQKAYPKSGNLEIGLLPFDSAGLCLAGIGLKAHGAGPEKPSWHIIFPSGRVAAAYVQAFGPKAVALPPSKFSHTRLLAFPPGREGMAYGFRRRTGTAAWPEPCRSTPARRLGRFQQVHAPRNPLCRTEAASRRVFPPQGASPGRRMGTVRGGRAGYRATG